MKNYTSKKLITPSGINSKKPTLRPIIISLLKAKDKDRILKASREKTLITYLSVRFTAKAMEAESSEMTFKY